MVKNLKPVIYLDIDGVLLDYGENPAPYAVELIDYLVNNHEVYWLTTHCRNDHILTQQHLSKFFNDQRTLKNISKIKSTNWDIFKTEAIDFSHEFIWLDDDLYDRELDVLKKNNKVNNIRIVDLRNDRNDLLNVIKELKNGIYPKAVKANLIYQDK